MPEICFELKLCIEIAFFHSFMFSVRNEYQIIFRNVKYLHVIDRKLKRRNKQWEIPIIEKY